MHHTKTIKFYSGSRLKSGDFIATYRGATILEIEQLTYSTLAHINTHGFNTRTTCRALNQAFADAGLPWRATLNQGIVNVFTENRQIDMEEGKTTVRLV